MKKIITVLTILMISLSNFSCGKTPSDNTNDNNKIPSVFDPSKILGIVSISPNAYKSLGTLAKITDESGKNRVVEVDNALKYKYKDENTSYYSFKVGVKVPKTSEAIFYLNDKEIKRIKEPTASEVEKMKEESLKNTGKNLSPTVFSDATMDLLITNDAVMWEDSQLNGETQFSFLTKAELIPAPRDIKERAKLNLKLKSDKKFNDYIELVKSPIHIATIGDSVMWGQGMSEEEHLMTKIAKKLGSEKNQIVRIVNYARSGARLGDPNDNKDLDLYGEIPSSSPSINAQLKRIIEQYKPNEGSEKIEETISPERVDLLVMDAGINNLGSSYILLGLDIRQIDISKEEKDLVNNNGSIDLNNKSIKSVAEKVFTLLKTSDIGNKRLRDEINKVYCFNDKKNDFSLCDSPSNYGTFLETARRSLPNAQIMTMGYFPLLTKDAKIMCDAPITVKEPVSGKDLSFNFGAKGILGMLTYFAVEPKLGETNSLIVSGLVSTLTSPISELIRTNSVNRSTIWTNQSNMILSKAVDIVSNKKYIVGRGNVRFVPISQKFENNPIFSKDSYLWGFAGNKCQKDGLVFPPEDLVIDKRKGECDKYVSENKKSPFYCYRVSLFHPNTKGFDNGYLPEITKYMENNGILSRDDL